jgi:hypothetical protein
MTSVKQPGNLSFQVHHRVPDFALVVCDGSKSGRRLVPMKKKRWVTVEVNNVLKITPVFEKKTKEVRD